jgi:hypothetical protein
MEDLIRKIQIHLETTEECIENTSLPQYVVELLEADNKLLSEVVTNYQDERMYSEEECYRTLHKLMMEIHFSGLVINDDMDLKKWFEQFKNK